MNAQKPLKPEAQRSKRYLISIQIIRDGPFTKIILCGWTWLRCRPCLTTLLKTASTITSSTATTTTALSALISPTTTARIIAFISTTTASRALTLLRPSQKLHLLTHYT